MEVNFLKQNPCIPSWPGVFQFDIFLRVVLSKSMCISIFGSSSSPSNSLVILFIHSSFLLCFFGCHILVQNRSVSFASSCWYVFVSSPPSWWENFLSLFWNVLFCLYCFTLCRYLFNLPSFASAFYFISSSCVVIFSCVAFSFLFLHIPASFLCFIILARFRRFLSAFSVEFPILVLIFSSCFFRGSQFFYKLISPRHRVVKLIRLYYSLIYKEVLDLFYSFPS